MAPMQMLSDIAKQKAGSIASWEPYSFTSKPGFTVIKGRDNIGGNDFTVYITFPDVYKKLIENIGVKNA